MKLGDIFYPLWKWWWMLAVTTLIAILSSFYIVRLQPPIYETRTTLLVGRAIAEPNPNNNEFFLSQQLAGAYATMVMRDPVRSRTMETLQLEELPEYKAQIVPNSQFIEIVVIDISPLRAQVVANELANQLIMQSPTSSRQLSSERQAFVDQQLAEMEASILATENEISTTQEELAKLTSAIQIADTQQRLAALQEKLSLLRNNYANLLSNTGGGAINTLSVIEPASLPTRPIGPNKPGIVALSAAIGLALAASAAHLLEYLNNTLESPQEISRVLGLPILGYIAEVKDSKGVWFYVHKHPRSPISEAFRSLRANLDFASLDYPLKSIFIASPDTAEGKTTVAINLAVTMGQVGKKVILVDADLRKPTVYKYPGATTKIGLKNVLVDDLDLREALRPLGDHNISILPSGNRTARSAELLSSEKMDQVLISLEGLCDALIIDGPPFFISDAVILSAKVDGVLIVIRPGHTREDVARSMMEQMDRAGARVLGIVLNRISRKNAVAYGSYRYYSTHYADSPYFEGEGLKPAGGAWRRILSPLVGRRAKSSGKTSKPNLGPQSRS